MTARATLLSSGYCALDVICHASAIGHHGGGTAANVAANAAHLGLPAAFTGRLGVDAPGDRVIQQLKAAGVDTALIKRDPRVQTPVVLHEATPPTHRFHFSCPCCQRDFPRHRPITHRHMAETVLPAIADRPPTIFFLDRASASCVALAERFRRVGSVVVFEPSARGEARRSARAAETAHLIKWSREWRARMRPELFDARVGQWQIETAGPRGLRFRRGTGRWTHMPGWDVDAVDPAGAGDWLTAALLADLGVNLPAASPADMAASLARAQAVAALNCLAVGARALATQPRAAIERATDAVLRGMPAPNRAVARLTRVCRPATCALCLAPLAGPVAEAADPIQSAASCC
jgi:fructokinase